MFGVFPLPLVSRAALSTPLVLLLASVLLAWRREVWPLAFAGQASLTWHVSPLGAAREMLVERLPLAGQWHGRARATTYACKG